MAWRRAAVVLACAACISAAAQAAGTLTVCIESAPEGMDVVQFETGVTINAAGVTLFDQLLSMAPGTADLRPGLAERWETSADGLTLTLHLRRGVAFHTTPWFKPTRTLNADDVVYSLERLRDKAHPAHAISSSGYVYWQGVGLQTLVRDTTKVDDHTVRIRLLKPDASFFSTLTMPSIGSVYPAEYIQALLARGEGAKLNSQPVGSGPFVFRSMQQGAVVRFDAHKAHWAGAPTIDRLVLAITPDTAVRAQKLKTGECQVGGVPRTEAAGIEADPALKLLRYQPIQTTYLFVNTQKPGLGDVRTRQALRLAIDYKAVMQAAFAGDAVATANLLPPAVAGHDPSLQPITDLARAAELIKASGGPGRELSLFIFGAANVRRSAEVLQADWARLGVKVNIRTMDLGELYRRTSQGEHDLAIASWTGDNGDADNFFGPLTSCAAVKSGGNKAHLCDPALDALIEDGRRTTDPKGRAAIYRKASARVHELSGLIPYAHAAGRIVLSRRVEGYVASPLGIEDYSRVTVKDAAK